jgi:hypothetical protein
LDETASGTEDVLLGGYLNDAVRDFLVRTRAHVNSSSMILTAGTFDYTTDDDILQILDLTLASSSQTYPFERTSPAEILRMRRTGSSSIPRFYALNGHDLLMVFPTPAAADTITVYYVPRPAEMSSGAHDPSAETYGNIPVEYHAALEEYAAWKMADYDDDQSSQMGAVYQGNYERLVRQALKSMRGKGGRSMGRAVIGRRGSLRSSPSQDW